jgi:hypothetical protein
LARENGIVIDDDTNTTIIVDDIFSYAKTMVIALLYMECQLRVAQSQNLSLSLKKSFIFPKRVEFVGVDVCQDGNRPAMSKHQLLVHWPTPVIVRDVAKFVGFLQFYTRFIPNFEVRISPLREIMREEYTSPIGSAWTSAANAAFEEMRQAILADPCLQRYDHRKLLVLCTDFSADGFGYVACQPADDDVSLATMHWCMRGDGFDFMTKTSSAVLHPVAFGCRRTRGNETKLHSHLGEGFATCALVSDSLGLQSVMRSSSFSRTTGETPPFSACRCGLCAGIWTLSIETTLFWVMLTIGHASVQTFVSILCLRPTSSR